MTLFPARAVRRFTVPLTVTVSTLAFAPSLADTATGVFTDRNETLLSLDAAHLNDAMTGAHFAGTRVTSVLDAGVSTYYYSNGGRTDYWATRPGVPEIQIGAGTQSVTESYGANGGVPISAAIYHVPKGGGGTVDVSVAYSGDTKASASLAQGILRTSAENGLAGPYVAAFPTAPYEGYGAYGTAFARAELADHLTASATTTLRLTGIWEGSLSSGSGSSGLGTTGSGIVLAQHPTAAKAHMEIGIWSAPHSVFHPGDEESPGFSTTQRSYLGGISLDQTVVYGQAAATIHQPFDVSVVVPAGNFYFYANQSVSTGGQTDPSQGTGGPVFANTVSTADFDHTLQFDLATSDGATLTSESGQFLAAVPEPGSWAALSGLALAGWAVARRRRDPRVV